MNNGLCRAAHATRLSGSFRGEVASVVLLFDQRGLQRFFLMLKPQREAPGLCVRRPDTRLSDEFSRRAGKCSERASPLRCAEIIDLTLLFRFVHIMKVIHRV